MRTTPTPDIEGMVHGGENRLRRRNSMRIGLAAAAVLLVGGGVYGAAQLADDGDPNTGVANQPSEPAGAAAPPDFDTAMEPLQPGTYRKYVGVHPETGAIEADITFGIEGWDLSEHHVLAFGQDFGGVSVYQVERLAGRDACDLTEGANWEALSRPAASTSAAVARQLTGLPHSQVVEPVTETQAFGHAAHHVRLRIDDTCAPGVYHLAETSLASHGISFSDYEATPPDVIVDFLVVDLDGSPVVALYWHHPDAESKLVDEVTAVRESITFVEAE